jgi:hypothetical protein
MAAVIASVTEGGFSSHTVAVNEVAMENRMSVN